MNCSLLALTLFSLAQLGANAHAQTCRVANIWVDPARGHDDPSAASDDYINDPATPCRTLQFAIDHMNSYLRKSWGTTNTTEGLVYAMPGLYGPHGPFSSGDTFPIWMQDRVHVQGVGARECVIRGGGVNTFGTFWPQPSLPPFGPQTQEKEVLIAFRDSSEFSAMRGPNGVFQPPQVPEDLAPWVGTGETAEMIDGFTFQGGDVQVYIAAPYQNGNDFLNGYPLAARVTNCVFDMRDQWVASEQVDENLPLSTYTVSGPTFGLLMAKPHYDGSNSNSHPPQPPGYFDQEVLIASNTFVMAEWRSGSGWIHTARSEAVAVIDVVDPNPLNGFPDANLQLRGVGNPNIINNLIRTWPGNQPANSGHMAMLGIERADTRASDDASMPLDTNAFAPSRVGSENQTFRSVPVQRVQVGVVTWPLAGTVYTLGPVFNCAAPCPAAPLPVPAVVLWSGSGSATPQPFDPGFVGEYLSSVSGVPSGYRDWRLLPESPLIDAGWYTEDMVFENGVTRFLPGTVCPEIESFDWDCEGYGNPRIVGERIDIGCDEMHMLIMAGSYANDSKGHNDNMLPKSHLHPSAPPGAVERQIITLQLFASQTLQINGTMSTPPLQPPALPAWSQPPVTLVPALNDAGAVPGYKTRYINQTNPAPTPTPWNFANVQPIPWNISSQLGLPGPAYIHSFVHVTVSDGECAPPQSCTNSYFNTQALVDFGSPIGRYRSNLQAEYR